MNKTKEQLEKELEEAKKHIESLIDRVDSTKYTNEDDEVGEKVCCGVFTYNAHEDDCPVVLAMNFLKKKN